MNILHVNNYHYLRGGSEAVYFNTAEVMERHGHQSLFYSMTDPHNRSCRTSGYFAPQVDFASGGTLTGQMKKAARLLYSNDAKRRLSRLVDAHEIDIAHLHNIYHELSPSVIDALEERHVPMVMTLHDYKMVCTSYSMLAEDGPCEACAGGRYYHAIKKRCVKGSALKSMLASLEIYLHRTVLAIYDKVDVYISPSLFLKNKLQEMGFKRKIVHVPNCIDTEKMLIAAGKPHYRDNATLTYFGRLSSEKGLWTLLHTAEKLQANRKNREARRIRIKIVGDGPLRRALERRAKNDGLSNVTFSGYLSGRALYDEVARSVAVIVPSEWYENNPLSVLEAFALGRPVVGARIGGIPELVKDKETGLTFEPGNADDLCEKILALTADRSLCARLGENARDLVTSLFSPERYYARLMEIYGEVLRK